MKLFNRFSFSSSVRRPRTLGRSSQAGITLIDLAIFFAAVSVAFAPSNAKELFVVALFVVFMFVVLTVAFVLLALALFLFVFAVSVMLEPEHREAKFLS